MSPETLQLAYVVSGILILIGLLGTVLPVLPGIPVAFAGMLLAAWAGGFREISVFTAVLLGLLTYFTAGPKEVRAWTVKVGATAPQAAGVIHTDFERGFIRAEVIAFEDYIALQGEHGAKEAGKLRLEGKEYIVREGDVMHFRFNV